MKIGPYTTANRLILAPMAGVTDAPFRALCRRLGAGLTPNEMTVANPSLRDSKKSQLRRVDPNEPAPKVVQIAGADPDALADYARYNVDNGADIIDINMGCPAKKVCNVAAGSALLRDLALVEKILRAVVKAVEVPVTLKTRTGWDHSCKNYLTVAQLAQDCGIKALTLHGRTRADRFNGTAEYESIARAKAASAIPIIANGDIDSPEKALHVLTKTQADGLMIGRAAQGNPWIFQQIQHYLTYGTLAPAPTLVERKDTILEHLSGLYDLYGEYLGPQVARKHIGWYLKAQAQSDSFRRHFNTLTEMHQQTAAITQYFEQKQQKIDA